MTVEYRKLGSCGLRVSVPIMGAMSYGSPLWGAGVDGSTWVSGEEDSLPVLKAAWDKGINTIDTANVYSNGESERVVAKFLETYNIPRHEVLILTKCFGLVANEPGLRTALMPELRKLPQYVNHYGLSRASIFNAVDASLERLKTSYVDLLQIHRFDPNTPVEETMKALHDLVQSGKVRYIGASSMRTWQFARMNEVADKHGWTKFVSMQNEYSLLYREEEREMLPYCEFNGIGVIPWAPLSGGKLCRPIGAADTGRSKSAKGTPWADRATEADQKIVNRVEEIAQKRGVTMTQVAIAWVANKVASPIIGISSVQRLEDNLSGLQDGFALSEEEKKYLEEPYVPKLVRGHP